MPFWIVNQHDVYCRTMRNISKMFGYEFMSCVRSTNHHKLSKMMSNINNDDIIAYGSVEFCKKILGEVKDLKCSDYYPIFGTEHLLNGIGIFSEVGDVSALVSNHFSDVDIVIRPDSGLKTFPVEIYKSNSFHIQWLDTIQRHRIPKNDVVLISPKVHIKSEYRFFVVDGTISTGCCYEEDGVFKPRVLTEDDLDVVSFATDIISQTSYEHIYVLDICRTDYDIKVIEVNVYCCSDFYSCDIQKFMCDVDNYYSKKRT